MADPDDGAGAAFIDDADGEMGEGSPGLFILDLLRDSAADSHLMELAEKVCVPRPLLCVDMLVSTGSGAMCGLARCGWVSVRALSVPSSDGHYCSPISHVCS